MSRSKKGRKPAGYDYWGKRALSGSCGYGKEVKKLTHAKERAQSKQALLHEPLEPEYDPREYIDPCADGDCKVCRGEDV